MDIPAMVFLLAIVIFCSILFFKRKESIFELKGQFLKHTNFVVLGLFIVNFQLYIDYVLGNIDSSNLFIWVNKSIVVKSFTLSTIGLISFYLGVFFYKNKVINTINHKNEEVSYSIKPLLYLSTIVLAAYFYTVNPLYLMGFYGIVGMGDIATYMSLLFNILILAIIIQSTRNLRIENKIPINIVHYVKLMGIPFLIILGVYLISVLISGDRGPIITIVLAYVSGYYFVKRSKLSYKTGLIFIFLGATIISLLGEVRSLDKNLSFTQKLDQSFNGESLDKVTSFSPSTIELAGSVKTTHYALNYVPKNHDFLYGRFQMQQLFKALPFLSIFNQLIYNDTSLKYSSSAFFITWVHQGNNPTYGDGSSCIADFYLDFGLFGVIIGMFLFGYFIRLAEVKMYNKIIPPLFTHIFIIVYLSGAIYIARSFVLFEFKNVVWIFILITFNKYIFNKKSKFG